jgi:hypothetical protein
MGGFKDDVERRAAEESIAFLHFVLHKPCINRSHGKCTGGTESVEDSDTAIRHEDSSTKRITVKQGNIVFVSWSHVILRTNNVFRRPNAGSTTATVVLLIPV